MQAPESALFRHGEGGAVFLAEAGRVRLRPVKVGKRSGVEAQVLEGLEPGDKAIVHPGDNVQAGVAYIERVSSSQSPESAPPLHLAACTEGTATATVRHGVRGLEE